MIMEVRKSHDQLSASWSSRKAGGVVPVWVWRSENQRADGKSSSLGAEDWCPSSTVRCIQRKFFVLLLFCSVQVFTGLDEAPPHCFTRSIDSNANLFWKYPNRHTEKCLARYLDRHPVASSSRHPKLTIRETELYSLEKVEPLAIFEQGCNKIKSSVLGKVV